jgi:MFS family permease
MGKMAKGEENGRQRANFVPARFGGIFFLSTAQKGLLAALMLGVFLGAADLSLLAPGLQPVARAFHVPTAIASWLVTLYGIVYAASLPVLGVLGDRHGRRRMFALGGAVFGLGSLAAGFSHGLWLLLLGRGLQALGAAAVLPLASAEIGHAFPADRRGALLGVLGLVYGVAAIIAPPIGGVLVAEFGWRWLFFATAPVGAVVTLLALLYVSEGTHPVPEPPDVQGAVLTALMAGAVLLGAEMLHRQVLPLGWASLVFGLLLLPNLVLWERAAASPIFRGGPRIASVYLLGALSAAVTAVALFVPLYAMHALRLGEAASGTALLPMAVAGAATSYYGGRLVDKRGVTLVLLAGFLLMAVGGAAVAVVAGPFGLIAGLLLVGGGVGLTMGSPLQYLLLGLAPKAQAGSAQALLGTFRALGVAIGPVIYGGMLPAFTDLFLAAAAIGFLGLVATLTLWGTRLSPDPV